MYSDQGGIWAQSPRRKQAEAKARGGFLPSLEGPGSSRFRYTVPHLLTPPPALGLLVPACQMNTEVGSWCQIGCVEQ